MSTKSMVKKANYTSSMYLKSKEINKSLTLESKHKVMLKREYTTSPVVKKRKMSPYLLIEDKQQLDHHVSLPFIIDNNSYDMKK